MMESIESDSLASTQSSTSSRLVEKEGYTVVSPPEPPPTHIDSLLVEKEGYGGFPDGAPITLFVEYLLLFFNKIEPPLPPFPLSPPPPLAPRILRVLK